MRVLENKREKFVRIAEARTNKAIDMIRLIGNCSNKSNYDYTEKDVNKIFDTLKKELNMAREQFNNTLKKNGDFKL